MRLRLVLIAALLAVATASAWAQQRGTTANPFETSSPGTQQPAAGTPTLAVPTATTGSRAPRYQTEAEAQGHCPGGSVVWVNGRSGAVHAKGDRYYGHTRSGAYACQGEVPARRGHAAH